MTEAIPDDPKKNICKDITRERAKLTIEKFEYDSGFEYMRVGQAMDAEALLSGKLPDVEQFGSYVFYLCTGEKTRKPVKKVEKNLYLVGAQGNVEIYLLYSQDYDELTRLALNLDVAEKIATSNQKRYVVYSPACFLDEDYLRAKQIEFVNIPYGLFQRKGNEA
jgi:adenine-specific DNA-methyltransferase